MVRKFFSGNSLQLAILQAASHYGIDPDRVAYTQREKKHGFIKSRRRVVIEVDPDHPEKSSEEMENTAASTRLDASEDTVVATNSEDDFGNEVEDEREDDLEGNDFEGEDDFDDEAEDDEADKDLDDESDDETSDDEDSKDSDESFDEGDDFDDEDDEDDEESDEDDFEDEGFDEDEDDEDFDDDEEFDDDEDFDDDEEFDDIDTAYEKAVRLLIRLLDLDLEYSIEEEDGTFFIDLFGEDAEDLTENDGEALRAIGHLLPRIVRGFAGESWPCKVDCNGFQQARIDELEEMAREAADDVRETGESFLLEPMNPADRRVVHLTLVDEPDVDTRSEGEGLMKRVRVFQSEE